MHIRLALQTFSENQQVNPGAFLMIMYLRANESNFYRQVKNKELSAQEMLCLFIITFAFCRSIVVVSFAKVHLSPDGAHPRPNRAIRCSRLAVRCGHPVGRSHGEGCTSPRWFSALRCRWR